MSSRSGDLPSSLAPWAAAGIKGLALLALGVACGVLVMQYRRPAGSAGLSDVFIISKKPGAGRVPAGSSAEQQSSMGRTWGPGWRGRPGGQPAKAAVVNLTAVRPAQLEQPHGQQQLEQLQQLLLHVQGQLRDMQQEVQQQREEQQAVQQQRKREQQRGHTAAAAAAAAPSWPTDHSDPTGDTCRDGLLAGPRSIFWQWNDDASPGLADVFHAEDRVYVVFNIKKQKEDKWDPLLGGNWSIEFYSSDPQLGLPRKTVRAYDIGRDGHSHTFTLTVPLPEEYASHPTNRSVRLDVRVRHEEGEKRYQHVPLCLRPQHAAFMKLAACTELTAEVADLVPEWVVFHHLQGVEHTYLYVNDKLDKVRPQLEPLVRAGLATVIDWEWPERYDGEHMFQQAEQNGCLLRMRGRARWVILHDVDEFVQPMQPGATVASFLDQHGGLDWAAALVLHGADWGSDEDEALQAQRDAAGGRLALARFRSRGECCEGGRKMIANPRGMSYNSVHGVTTGGQERELDGWTELRLNHVKGHLRQPVSDDSLAAYVDAINGTLQELGYAL